MAFALDMGKRSGKEVCAKAIDNAIKEIEKVRGQVDMVELYKMCGHAMYRLGTMEKVLKDGVRPMQRGAGIDETGQSV